MIFLQNIWFGCQDVYFECLDLYFGCLNIYFGFWIHIFSFELIFWVSGLMFGVSGLMFWMSGITFWVSKLILRVSGCVSGRARPDWVTETFGAKIDFGNMCPEEKLIFECISRGEMAYSHTRDPCCRRALDDLRSLILGWTCCAMMSTLLLSRFIDYLARSHGCISMKCLLIFREQSVSMCVWVRDFVLVGL